MKTSTTLRKAGQIKEAYEMGIIYSWELKDQLYELAEKSGMSYEELLSESV